MSALGLWGVVGSSEAGVVRAGGAGGLVQNPPEAPKAAQQEKDKVEADDSDAAAQSDSAGDE